MEFLHGELVGNQAATLSHVRQYFNQLGTRRWEPRDRFVMFVADHGMPDPWDPTAFIIDNESQSPTATPDYDYGCIDLWSPGLTSYPEEQCLKVSELKRLIRANIPNTVPVNFVMNQCFSGAFHLLGYTKDAQGFPHTEGNICGFTSIIKDATAAGCTEFVDGELYDGYERRMTESITGVVTLTGKPTDHPAQPQLSKAHDQALLLDNTKDVPLRTSEAYALEYAAAEALHSKDDAFESSLESVWSRFVGKERVATLDGTLHADRLRRLQIIQALRAQIGQWHPLYRDRVARADLADITQLHTAAQEMVDTLDSQKNTALDAFVEKIRPLEVAYYQSILGAEEREFSMVVGFNRRIQYTRLAERDPTLALYARFVDWKEKRDARVLAWSSAQGDRFNKAALVELRQIHAKHTMLKKEITRMEVVTGVLHRLEIQMRVTAIVEYMAQTRAAGALKDMAALVHCENEARVGP